MSRSDIWVMCGGSSATQKIDTNDPVIAVNKDVWRYTNADYFITMDNRFTIWEIIGNRDLPSKPVKFFVVNMASNTIRCDKSFIDDRWGTSYSIGPYDIIIKSQNQDGFGFTWNDFRNGANSGHCGVQLAILLGFKNIHLVGMDLCKNKGTVHHHEGYNKCKDDYDALHEQFFDRISRAIVNELSHHPEIKLINHSSISRLRPLIGFEPL
jgi:hypothetical protein